DLLALAGAPRDFLHADHTAQAAPALRAGANLLAAYAGAPVLAQPGRAWRGEAGGFADASVDWGLDAPGVNLAMAAADLDRDGDLDLIEIGLGAPARVLANAGTDPRGILVRLRGTGWNTFGIGARLEFAGAAGQQVRWIAAGGSEPIAHLGLGKAESLAKLDVVWPSGARQELRDLPANH
ncbi:MAG: ASPIC/UnbV domain-containing protein, partial [Verrucomicrobiae bacterium]|nr:ASPIC/UnbV domain-containing protein [Verrucomicrobiae bacterium]